MSYISSFVFGGSDNFGKVCDQICIDISDTDSSNELNRLKSANMFFDRIVKCLNENFRHCFMPNYTDKEINQIENILELLQSKFIDGSIIYVPYRRFLNAMFDEFLKNLKSRRYSLNDYSNIYHVECSLLSKINIHRKHETINILRSFFNNICEQQTKCVLVLDQFISHSFTFMEYINLTMQDIEIISSDIQHYMKLNDTSDLSVPLFRQFSLVFDTNDMTIENFILKNIKIEQSQYMSCSLTKKYKLALRYISVIKHFALTCENISLSVIKNMCDQVTSFYENEHIIEQIDTLFIGIASKHRTRHLFFDDDF